MRKLVNTKLFILGALLICATVQLEAKDVYVSTAGSTSAAGTEADPVNIAGFMTIFEAHDSGKGATFNAYFEPGEYILPKTLTLTAAQGNVLFVLDKKPGTTGDVIFTPANTTANNSTGVYRSSASDMGCNITFRNMIFDGFRGHATSSDATYRIFGISHNGNVLTVDHVTVRNSTAGLNFFVLRATENGAGANFYIFISEINIYNSSIINNQKSANYAICDVINGNMRVYNSTFSGNAVTYVTYADNGNPGGLNNKSRGYIAFVNNTVYNSG
ncbi:MAG: hypothetical protein LBJ60_09255, partial [Tannerellaceae bacterium]|nr:hypothetical protein [Tannerellaceae bacterium]